MRTAAELAKQYADLKDEAINLIKELVGHKKIGFDEAIEDDANNFITHVNRTNVYFDGGTESYPLHLLSMQDAFSIIIKLENQIKTK